MTLKMPGATYEFHVYDIPNDMRLPLLPEKVTSMDDALNKFSDNLYNYILENPQEIDRIKGVKVV